MTVVDLPPWATWWPRPFPDGNLLLLTGRETAIVDTGFVAHADQTAAWVRAHAKRPALVVNTHWHADHVGGNAALQRAGAAVAASARDAADLAQHDPGCCSAEYLDQPVAPYTVDIPLTDGQYLTLGDAPWQVLATPGHTPGHLALWQPDERLLAVGDALSDYDVGWVNRALDGPHMAATALASLRRLQELRPRLLLPAHGPIPADFGAAFDAALRRAQRLVDDPDGAVWYGARRIFAYALMIRSGIARDDAIGYLLARTWVADAAMLLRMRPEDLAQELITGMLRSGVVVERDRRLQAAADHTPVRPGALDAVPLPRNWPKDGQRPEPAAGAQRAPRPAAGPADRSN